MPLMELTYEKGILTPEARDQLVEDLTTNLLKAEGAPNTEFFRSVTWVLINERPAALTYAGVKIGGEAFELKASETLIATAPEAVEVTGPATVILSAIHT